VIDSLLLGNSKEHPPKLVAILNIAESSRSCAAAKAAENAYCNVFFISSLLGSVLHPTSR
jgi:hypothetical protein